MLKVRDLNSVNTRCCVLGRVVKMDEFGVDVVCLNLPTKQPTDYSNRQGILFVHIMRRTESAVMSPPTN